MAVCRASVEPPARRSIAVAVSRQEVPRESRLCVRIGELVAEPRAAVNTNRTAVAVQNANTKDTKGTKRSTWGFFVFIVIFVLVFIVSVAQVIGFHAQR